MTGNVCIMEDRTATELVRNFLQCLAGDRAREATIEFKPLRGGLEAVHVTLVTARYADAARRPRIVRFVMKQLSGRAMREAFVYERVVSAYASDVAPAVLAIEQPSPCHSVLYIEAIRPVGAWPWPDLLLSRRLLRRLAEFHIAAAGKPELLPEWDYDGELEYLARETESALESCRCDPDLSILARELRPVKRMVLARGRLRRQLCSERPFRIGPIHGDVHPGNTIVRRRHGADQPILLDWARARLGSPLEDVSSWLHSLGFWEAEARRRHDTLLAEYLTAYGMERKLLPHVRAAYWLAGTSNALSGALLHHILVARNEAQSPRRRLCAMRAAHAWLRVIRRADSWSS
jgi:hypothetical protein